MSGSDGVLVNGPESPYVVAAVESLLDGDREAAREVIHDGARATSWAALAHRLDVAGRALAADVDDDADVADVAERAATGDADADEARAVLAAWRHGGGLAVAVDLTTGDVDVRPEADRVWSASRVLAQLVERSGFPAQVVV